MIADQRGISETVGVVRLEIVRILETVAGDGGHDTAGRLLYRLRCVCVLHRLRRV